MDLSNFIVSNYQGLKDIIKDIFSIIARPFWKLLIPKFPINETGILVGVKTRDGSMDYFQSSINELSNGLRLLRAPNPFKVKEIMGPVIKSGIDPVLGNQMLNFSKTTFLIRGLIYKANSHGQGAWCIEPDIDIAHPGIPQHLSQQMAEEARALMRKGALPFNDTPNAFLLIGWWFTFVTIYLFAVIHLLMGQSQYGTHILKELQKRLSSNAFGPNSANPFQIFILLNQKCSQILLNKEVYGIRF